MTGIEKKEDGNDKGDSVSDSDYSDNDDGGIIDNEAGNDSDIN